MRVFTHHYVDGAAWSASSSGTLGAAASRAMTTSAADYPVICDRGRGPSGHGGDGARRLNRSRPWPLDDRRCDRTGKADLGNLGLRHEGLCRRTPGPVLLLHFVRQPNTIGGRIESPIRLDEQGESRTTLLRSVEGGYRRGRRRWVEQSSIVRQPEERATGLVVVASLAVLAGIGSPVLVPSLISGSRLVL